MHRSTRSRLDTPCPGAGTAAATRQAAVNAPIVPAFVPSLLAALVAAGPALGIVGFDCGLVGSGSCYEVHPGAGCDNNDCCNAVCAVDFSCCTVAWDSGCVDTAYSTCDASNVGGLVINPVNGHRYRLVSPSSWNEFVSYAAGLSAGGTFGCPLTIGDGFENQWVRCNLASNVPGIAGPTDLFISEYYEGTGADNHAIEIYNGTSRAVNLNAEGYKIQIFADGSATPTASFNLVGTIFPGGTWVVAPAGANATILDKTNQVLTNAFAFNGDDAIALVVGPAGTLIDVVGQIGLDPGTEWGSGVQSTADAALRRKSGICAGDAVGSDSFEPAVEWDGVSAGDASDLGIHAADCIGAFSVWTGYNDVDAEGTFEWWCVEPATYTNWLEGEPNNGGNSDYTELLGDSGRWRDRGNQASEYGVVEFEFIACGSGGGCFSQHGPGCNNESCCQTVCFIDDFCCEIQWDGLCVDEAQGLCSPGIEAGPILNPANGHHYYLLETAAWSEAQEKALSLNGHLATIDDAAENAWVLANVAQFDGDMTRVCFLGLNDQVTEGAFQWLDHSLPTYVNWAAGEPNNAGGIEHFAEMLADGTWRDNDNTGSVDFTTFAIVEVPCFGDLDGNGTVDGGDLGLLLGAFSTTDKATDLNQDGIVDGADLGLMLGAWGPCD